MRGKYMIKEFADVFRDEFLQLLLSSVSDVEDFTKTHLKMAMEKIEKFEQREEVEFVSFFGTQFIIFKVINEN